MGNTELTKASVVTAAYRLACQVGLLQISVRTVASEAGFSKTGTITHFKNLETLQLAVLDHAALIFSQEIFSPALSTARGLPRLREIVRRWVTHNSERETCLFISASFEVDSRPGPIREHIERWMRELRKQLCKAIEMAVEEGHLSSNTPAEEVAFAIFSLATGAHHDAHMLQSKQSSQFALSLFESLIKTYQIQ